MNALQTINGKRRASGSFPERKRTLSARKESNDDDHRVMNTVLSSEGDSDSTTDSSSGSTSSTDSSSTSGSGSSSSDEGTMDNIFEEDEYGR